MTVLSRTGAAHRTKLMTQDRAERFARCIQANPRFVNVVVSESPRSAGKFLVTFNTSSDETGEKIRQDAHTARLERALVDGKDFIFVADDGGEFIWCMSTSGETYEVTSASCTCPDHQYRCRPNGLQCKHQLALIHGAAPVRSWAA